MSFWGMSNAGKEANGFARESGAWTFQQFKEWLQKSKGFEGKADELEALYTQYQRAKLEQGWRSPDEIRQAGQQISPWVQAAIDAGNGRLSSMLETERNLPRGNETADVMSGRLDEIARGITGNYDSVEGDINQTAGRAFTRESDLNRDVVNNIKDTGASMRGAVNDTFTGLRRDNASTAQRAMDMGRTTFGESLRSLELLKPGGTAQTARVARSFAPNIADTLTRLRRSGVDPNSPQAAAALRQVETSRSRAMDDASAQATTGYVDRGNTIRNQQLGFLTETDRARLGMESNLATGQVDRTNDISGKESDQFIGEQRRSTNANNTIDRDRSGRAVDNLNRTSDQSNALQLERTRLDLQRRGMNQEDADRISRILLQQNAQDVQNGGLLDNQFSQGNNWYLLDQATRDQGAAGINSVAQANRSNQFGAANTAMGFNTQATQNYNTAYDREKQDAGWGVRMLGGIAAAGLSMVSPGTTVGRIASGVGGVLTGAVNGAYGGGGGTSRASGGGGGGTSRASGGGGGGGGQGGQFGGGAGRNGSFSFSDAQGGIGALSNLFRNNQNVALQGGRWAPQWNPARTTNLPNGDLQVGR